jgi:hypothetical protein
VAAGPISSAVDKIAPVVSDDSPTAMASATMYATPTRRTGTPRAAAMSGLTVASSSGRQITAMTPAARMLKAAMTGIVVLAVVKIEPNRTCWVAPVVALAVASR